MKLDLDAQGYVRGYTDSGEATGVDYDGVVPDDFAETCRDYRYQDGALLFDAERAAFLVPVVRQPVHAVSARPAAADAV